MIKKPIKDKIRESKKSIQINDLTLWIEVLTLIAL